MELCIYSYVCTFCYAQVNIYVIARQQYFYEDEPKRVNTHIRWRSASKLNMVQDYVYTARLYL